MAYFPTLRRSAAHSAPPPELYSPPISYSPAPNFSTSQFPGQQSYNPPNFLPLPIGAATSPNQLSSQPFRTDTSRLPRGSQHRRSQTPEARTKEDMSISNQRRGTRSTTSSAPFEGSASSNSPKLHPTHLWTPKETHTAEIDEKTLEPKKLGGSSGIPGGIGTGDHRNKYHQPVKISPATKDPAVKSSKNEIKDVLGSSSSLKAAEQAKTAEELRRRGSADDRAMSSSTTRLFSANPDLSKPVPQHLPSKAAIVGQGSFAHVGYEECRKQTM